MDPKLIVGSHICRDAKNELVRKRPKPALLQNKPIKRKSQYLEKILKKASC